MIDLDGSYSEGPGQAGLFSQITEDLNRITERLDQAAKDNKISGVLLNFGSLELGRGKIHELARRSQEFEKPEKKFTLSSDPAKRPTTCSPRPAMRS